MSLRHLLDQWLSGAIAPPPIVRKLGIRLLSFSDGQALTEMHVTQELWNAMGTLHGGVFADLADVAMGVALATSTRDGETFTSVNLSIAFFAPVREGLLRASASVARRGRTSGYTECTIENEAGVLVAKASSLCSFHTPA
jgi:uncharacterized protein (TIGR00369 family)